MGGPRAADRGRYSPLGMWLATELPLAPDRLIRRQLRPPRWPAWGAEITVLAEVVRVGLPRRRGDNGQAGMGLRFVDLDPEHAQRMIGCLLGLPPTLPALRAQRAERSEEQLVFEDGTSFELCAEAELLTAGRANRAGADRGSRAAARLAAQRTRCAPSRRTRRQARAQA